MVDAEDDVVEKKAPTESKGVTVIFPETESHIRGNGAFFIEYRTPEPRKRAPSMK